MNIREKIKIAFREALLDEERRFRLQFFLIYILLGAVSLVMTIVNIFTHENVLMLSTLAFTLLMGLNVALALLGHKSHLVSRVLFIIELLALFTFFLLSGHPQGFSALWILMLPSLGMLLFGAGYCSLISAVMLVIIIIAFWTPFGQSLLSDPNVYTSTFMLRFPFAYIAFFATGFLFEKNRAETFKNFKYASTHDTLTGALNRQGFYDYVNKVAKESKRIGFVIFDIDHFKSVNDTYGHFVGDEVLKNTCNAISEELGIPLCRWGGEEFTAFFSADDITPEKIEELIKNLAKIENEYAGEILHVTVSAGAIFTAGGDFDLTEISIRADDCLYQAKEQGRNRAIIEIDK